VSTAALPRPAAGPIETARHLDVERTDRRHSILLALPALALVGLTLLLPLGWLLTRSFIAEGSPSLAHYGEAVAHPNTVYLANTLKLAAAVTVVAALLAYPTCYALTKLPRRLVGAALLLVLLPFFTSALVRTYAWLIILQRRGLINRFLQDQGLIEQPLQLAYNFLGTGIGMVHVLLPLLVLPLYAAMRGIDPSLMKAGASLGASRMRLFWTIFFPLSLPGFVSGVVIVFVLALGFYITPAILGGGRVVVWATLIETTTVYDPDWGAASALGVLLLVVTFAVLGAARLLAGLAPFGTARHG
jgi:putative spermidine/putrescine transport system permease protein